MFPVFMTVIRDSVCYEVPPHTEGSFSYYGAWYKHYIGAAEMDKTLEEVRRCDKNNQHPCLYLSIH